MAPSDLDVIKNASRERNQNHVIDSVNISIRPEAAVCELSSFRHHYIIAEDFTLRHLFHEILVDYFAISSFGDIERHYRESIRASVGRRITLIEEIHPYFLKLLYKGYYVFLSPLASLEVPSHVIIGYKSFYFWSIHNRYVGKRRLYAVS